MILDDYELSLHSTLRQDDDLLEDFINQCLSSHEHHRVPTRLIAGYRDGASGDSLAIIARGECELSLHGTLRKGDDWLVAIYINA